MNKTLIAGLFLISLATGLFIFNQINAPELTCVIETIKPEVISIIKS